MKIFKSKFLIKGITSFVLAGFILIGSVKLVSAEGCGQWYIASVTKPTCPDVYDCGPGSGLRTHFQIKNMERKCVDNANRIYIRTKQKREVLGCC